MVMSQLVGPDMPTQVGAAHRTAMRVAVFPGDRIRVWATGGVWVNPLRGNPRRRAVAAAGGYGCFGGTGPLTRVNQLVVVDRAP